jgi:hypothetical protein
MKKEKNKKRHSERFAQKGFSFSFDGIVGAIVIFGIMGFIAANTMNTYEFSSQKIVQKQLADDILKAGIDLNKFQGENSGEINGLIQSVLPLNYDYQLELKKYNPNNLNPIQTTTYGNILDANNQKYVETKKIFSTYYNSDANAFYSATLRVWLR